MSGSVTHFEIFGERPSRLAEFYQRIFGWQVEQMPGIDYWRVQTGAPNPQALHGGLTHRSIPGVNGWLLYVNVPSLDDTEAMVRELGGSILRPKTAVPRTAWVTIVADPEGNAFGIWQADSKAFPMPDPD
jgi:hypothetical protein